MEYDCQNSAACLFVWSHVRIKLKYPEGKADFVQ